MQILADGPKSFRISLQGHGILKLPRRKSGTGMSSSSTEYYDTSTTYPPLAVSRHVSPDLSAESTGHTLADICHSLAYSRGRTLESSRRPTRSRWTRYGNTYGASRAHEHTSHQATSVGPSRCLSGPAPLVLGCPLAHRACTRPLFKVG